ncbi:MAG TPA: DUF2497 domain-containing protein [Aliidongia sp.]|nr:DUF2497 domain-containing protein [Aliidongia sp.]
MEEILASIRRIIAEDGDEAPAAAAAAAEKPPEPEPDAPAPVHEDILELTEVVPEEPKFEARPSFEPLPEPEPEPFHEPPRRPERPSLDDDDDRLVSPRPAAASSAAFASMTSRLRERRGGETYLGNGSITLEELVRDMLRPMLQEWLDANLPSVVERLVREEVERIARDAL